MKKLSLTVAAIAMQAAFAASAHAQIYNAPQPQPYCREYTQIVKIGSTQQKGYGTACLQPDGSWQMMPNSTTTAPPPPGMAMVPNGAVMVPAPPQNTTYIIQESPAYYRYGPPAPVVDVVVGRYPNHWHRW